MRIVNLTPHALTLRSTNGVDTVIEPDPQGPARVGSAPGAPVGEWRGVALHAAPTWGEVEGLPEPEPGVLLVVSSVVAARCGGRPDVFSPGTGPEDGAIRDETGQVSAVTRLNQAPESRD